MASIKWTIQKNNIIEDRFDLNLKKTHENRIIIFSKNMILPNMIDYGNKKTFLKYDLNGNIIEQTFRDKQNNLLNNKRGTAQIIRKYNSHGNLISFKLLDSNGIEKTSRLINSHNYSTDFKANLEDVELIKKTALGYLIALQTLDPNLMKKVMHKKLAKHTIGYDFKTKKQVPSQTTYDQMINFAKTWNKAGNKFPPNPKNIATLMDYYNNIATVKLQSSNWHEYVQLGKFNGEWKIIHLLWIYRNLNR